jgi:hypothetical protein
VRYGDVYSVKFTYLSEEALQAHLWQIVIQTAENSDTSDNDASSDDGSDSDNAANAADIACFNALCSSHRLSTEETVKAPTMLAARKKAGSGSSSSAAAVKADTRSLAKLTRKEDIIINQELKKYFGKTVVFQGRGLNIHEDRYTAIDSNQVTTDHSISSQRCCC